MADTDGRMTEIDDMFRAARAEAAVLPGGLEARILADAAQVQTDRAAARLAVRPKPAGPLRQLWTALGGWPAFGGLVAASAAGIWIGFAPPAFLPDPVGAFVQTDTETVSFDAQDLFGALTEEG